MKRFPIHHWIIFCIASLAILSCTKEGLIVVPKGNTNIIPVPINLEKKEGHFLLNEAVKIILPNSTPEWIYVANNLNHRIKSSTGKQLETAVSDDVKKDAINITIDKSIESKEGYRLMVNSFEIEIKASSPEGAFRGMQSLIQMMPAEVFGQSGALKLSFKIPQVEINDAPRFSYRGMHLDVARHFFSVDEVKRYIDLLSLHKMNTFHWHLTDDQGWRIEIKKYPKLTAVGGFRNETLVGHYNDQPHKFDGKRYGGFYTQEEIKEVVQFAQERFITVIPEIELPGHAQAAIAAYPELGCNNEDLEVMKIWGISNNVYCPTEFTFNFLENVLDEVAELFPSNYLHIGGDECAKTQWKNSPFCQRLMKDNNLDNELELQSYFIQRIEKYLNAKGKRIIGWDEILEGGLAPNASVMSWRGEQGGIDAATQGHDVVMTPTSHCYFDYYQSQHKDEPLAIGGFLPLEKVYNYEPIPKEVPVDKIQHIKGLQCNLWTEYIQSREQLDYMAYPRACAIAEVGWSSKPKRNFSDFVNRLESHLQNLKQYGVNYSHNHYDIDGNISTKNNQLLAALVSNVSDTEIRYTLDGSAPNEQSKIYTDPIPIETSCELKAQGFQGDVQQGRSFEKGFNLHLASGKSIELKYDPAPHYASGGNSAIINGIIGSNERFGDKEWLGFSGNNFEGIINLGGETKLNTVRFRFFKAEGQWIYLPKDVKIYGSLDGNNFDLIGEENSIDTHAKIAQVMLNIKGEFSHLKIVAERYGIIPDGQQGGGHEAWLFIDEIVVN